MASMSPFTVVGCFLLSGGVWQVYGQQFEQISRGRHIFEEVNSGKRVRTTIGNAETFENQEVVSQQPPAAWTGHCIMEYNPVAKECRCFEKDSLAPAFLTMPTSSSTAETASGIMNGPIELRRQSPCDRQARASSLLLAKREHLRGDYVGQFLWREPCPIYTTGQHRRATSIILPFAMQCPGANIFCQSQKGKWNMRKPQDGKAHRGPGVTAARARRCRKRGSARRPLRRRAGQNIPVGLRREASSRTASGGASWPGC